LGTPLDPRQLRCRLFPHEAAPTHACLARRSRAKIRPFTARFRRELFILKTSSTPPLRALFLGTAAGNTSVSRDHSGILLETDGSSILLDCGAVAARHFHANDFPTNVPGALWLSHMHSDHVGQVGMLIQSLWLRTRREPLHVYGPPGVVGVMKDWLERCLLFPELIGFPIEWHAVQPGVPVVYGPFTLTAFPTEHLTSLANQFRAAYPATCFQCYGVALDCHGRRYVYSADLAHPRELAPALEQREVTALICELAHFPERELFQELARYDVKTLWLTHFPDAFVGQEKKLRMTAQEQKFTGIVHLLQDKVAEDI
jgi:ribonuclease BN (tRNA processing enzyme)